MNRRHTILLDGELEEPLRKIQSEMIKESKTSISFSLVINVILADGLAKRKHR